MPNGLRERYKNAIHEKEIESRAQRGRGDINYSDCNTSVQLSFSEVQDLYVFLIFFEKLAALGGMDQLVVSH